MTAAIATKVPTASAARSGFVIAVSSGLVAGVGLPAQAADASSDAATTTASLKLPAFAPAAEQVAVDQAVSAPTTATLHFERSALRASLRGGAPDANSTAKAAQSIATVSRSLTRAAFGQEIAAQQRADRAAKARLAQRTTPRVSRSGQRSNPPHVSPAPVPVNGSRGAAVVAIAKRYLGVPYVYGGTSPNGFDCSGFVQYVFREHGIELPRTSRQMANAGVRLPVRIASLSPGDLMLFSGTTSTISHVAIYAGNGRILHSSSSGHGVKYDELDDTRRGRYFTSHFVAARRVIANGNSLVQPLARLERLVPFDHYDPPDAAPPR
jgi:cell wall-associated NlpC family hydrolase